MTIIDAKGGRHVFGDITEEPGGALRIHSQSLPYRAMIDPELKLAEAYMDGELTIADGSSLIDVMSVIMANEGPMSNHLLHRLLLAFKEGHTRRKQRLDVRRDKQHVRHHYDLSAELYELFLDGGMNYSCGYYESPETPLEDAQNAKLNHIVAKLDLREGQSLLEIGGGWGSLAIRLAQAGAQVTSLNVSREQIAVAQKRVELAGVADKVEFLCVDYREFEGQYDKVVSVGMMEHVGIGNYEQYFARVRDCLKPNGSALIHSIGRYTPPGVTGPFLAKYIFPGGYCPALSEVFAAVEKQGLWVCDNEVLRLHYYYTVRDWRRKFERNRSKIRELYDERFCRMWELYLTSVELGFLLGPTMVFQLMLAKERDAVPILRGYIDKRERELNKRFDKMPAPMRALHEAQALDVGAAE
ncbi:SAM-dependent methyltransferase [Polycladidibacter hongkongensis]|uniref:SAM-dependent methyltransferase n=1 Tax=Polycladidibacter hongkongensis TaxID=1647556 RepID=UPI001FCB7860|nr:cyclopropane-fatty-acyl-phospholipid synthase family protein [Pseudovibrio hongkongensis]